MSIKDQHHPQARPGEAKRIQGAKEAKQALATESEFATELAPQGSRQPMTPFTEKDPQQSFAAGPDVWGAPD